MRRLFTAFALALACMVGGGVAFAAGTSEGPVHSTPGPIAPPPNFQFQGKPIDLSQGWGLARSCVLWSAAGLHNCYASEDGMQAAVTQAKIAQALGTGAFATAGVHPLTACSSPLDLWSDEGYAGSHVSVYDRGYWHSMATLGMDNALSSFIVGACGSHLAEDGGGTGNWYPCSTSAGAAHREMDIDNNNGGPPCAGQSTNWNDRVSSVYLT